MAEPNFFDQFDDKPPGKPGVNFFDQFDAQKPAIDFAQPKEKVRAEIAKIPAGPLRDKAMRDWADAYVAAERGPKKPDDGSTTWIGPVGWGPKGPAARFMNPADIIRTAARGTLVGGAADELNAVTNAALNKVTGGAVGAPYDESIEYQRALDRAVDRDNPVGSKIAKVGGGLASGAPLAKLGFDLIKNKIGQTVLGSVLGGGYATTSGLLEGEGGLDERWEEAKKRMPAGILIGGALPPSIAGIAYGGGKVHDMVSPTLARMGAYIGDIPKRVGLPGLSADAERVAAAAPSSGAQAAAEQVLANQLVREGVTTADLRKQLERVAEGNKYWTSGQAQDTTALVDLTPGLQRLAGSAVRASPEAGNRAKAFIEGRQTGVTPQGKTATELADMGLPTKPLLAAPQTGKETQKALGSKFATPANEVVPMGQGERFYDALKRALLIADEKSHGHAATGYLTKQKIAETARQEAKPAYDAFYEAGNNIDIRPSIQPVLDYWIRGDRLANEAEEVQKIVRKIASMFEPNGSVISNAERFDRTKQYIDATYIDKLFESTEGKNRYLGGLLSDLRNDLLKGLEVNGQRVGGMDNIPQVGELYQRARSLWASHQQTIEAIELGQKAWKENSDIGVEHIQSAINDGMEKFVRLGLLDGYRLAAAGMKRGADKGQLFDTPRMQDILQAAIPRTISESGKINPATNIAKNPERFGQFVGTEKSKIETRNIVQGGSPTQRNIKDDDSYEIMSRWSEMIENFKTTRSITRLGIDAVGNMLNKLFGMRADTSAALAQRLFTANPAERARILNAVEQRMGKNRFDQFTRLMDEYYTTVVAARQATQGLPQE